MTEQTIRLMAKELAGIFYEDNRSPAFRQAYPTLKHYMRGQWVQQNGDIKIDNGAPAVPATPPPPPSPPKPPRT